MDNLRRPAKSKILGVLFMLIGVFGILVILHRICAYVFEYDPEFYSVDYGRFNLLAFFTVQSNILVSFYFIAAALGIFGCERAAKIAFNPTFGCLVTTYIIVTGAVFCSGIPMGMTPPLKWDTPLHGMLAFVQILHHMIIPGLCILLWFFPFSDKKIPKDALAISGLYPLAYSLFSIVRGAVSDPTYYPYPFFNPEFIYSTVFPDRKTNIFAGYAMLLPLLCVGIGLFVAVCAVVRLIGNKRRS